MGLYGDIRKKVAPCGLLCYTCTGFAEGAIPQASKALLRYLDGYSEFLEQQSHPDKPAVDTALRALAFWAGNDCPGCREGGDHRCMLEGCTVRECTKGKGIDFCAECAEFPCGEPHPSKVFLKAWKKANSRIREIGAEGFFQEEKEVSHYSRYKQAETR